MNQVEDPILAGIYYPCGSSGCALDHSSHHHDLSWELTLPLKDEDLKLLIFVLDTRRE